MGQFERHDHEQFYREQQAKLDDFDAALKNFAEKVVPEKILSATKEIALDVLDGVAAVTPVDTGRARANWNVAIGLAADTSVTDDENRDSVAEGAAVLAKLKPFQAATISNNVVYIGALERGHSDKAPVGMLGVTLDGIRPKIERGDYFD